MTHLEREFPAVGTQSAGDASAQGVHRTLGQLEGDQVLCDR